MPFDSPTAWFMKLSQLQGEERLKGQIAFATSVTPQLIRAIDKYVFALDLPGYPTPLLTAMAQRRLNDNVRDVINGLERDITTDPTGHAEIAFQPIAALVAQITALAMALETAESARHAVLEKMQPREVSRFAEDFNAEVVVGDEPDDDQALIFVDELSAGVNTPKRVSDLTSAILAWNPDETEKADLYASRLHLKIEGIESGTWVYPAKLLYLFDLLLARVRRRAVNGEHDGDSIVERALNKALVDDSNRQIIDPVAYVDSRYLSKGVNRPHWGRREIQLDGEATVPTDQLISETPGNFDQGRTHSFGPKEREGLFNTITGLSQVAVQLLIAEWVDEIKKPQHQAQKLFYCCGSTSRPKGVSQKQIRATAKLFKTFEGDAFDMYRHTKK